MEIKKLNKLANEIVECRSAIKEAEEDFESRVIANPSLYAVRENLEGLKKLKTELNGELLEIMQKEELKQWKTDKNTFSRAKQTNVSILQTAKRKLIDYVKAEPYKYPFLELRETEYISIRNLKNG